MTFTAAPPLPSPPYGTSTDLTIAGEWVRASGHSVGDHLLVWPPDVFALTDVIVDRTEAYRFVVAPPPGQAWPPGPQWSRTVVDAAHDWSHSNPESGRQPPDIVVQAWEILTDGADTPLDEIASGRAWPLCEALLTLHAIADEACASSSADASEPATVSWRLREHLNETGSMSRIPPGLLRVLPKYRTPSGGISARSVSRHACVIGPGVDVRVHQAAGANRNPTDRQLNLLLLPWPLTIRDADFQPVSGSVQERPLEPFGYFQFQPSEPFDLALADRLLTAAAEKDRPVDIVVLPECSLPLHEIARLEDVLSRHGVTMLIAGITEASDPSVSFGSNWVQLAVSSDGQWRHYRQDKHHRWSLDPSQIEQYHLGQVLDPRVRWWEATDVARRSVALIERGDGHTVASLVCEDLAHIDEGVELLRAVGPTLIVALLLDGPQLTTRWTARYASVLADDPGSTVISLSSYGMVRRAWRPDRPPSSVVALWKEPARGMREITLDPDARGILVTGESHPALRRAADGRPPQQNVTDLRLGEITQL